MNLSAEKRVRQNKKRRLHNRMVKSEVRTEVKSFESAVNANNAEQAKEKLLLSISLLDKAVSKGVLHKNTASRKKSRMSRAYNVMTKAA